MLRLPSFRSAFGLVALLLILCLLVVLSPQRAEAQLRPSLEELEDASQPRRIVASDPFPDYRRQGPGAARQVPNVADAERAVPDQTGSETAETDPFAPIGIRTGSFVFLPSLTQSIGHSSNADGFRGGKASAFSETKLALEARSDWSRHELLGSFTGTWQEFFNGETESLPELDASATLRIDLAREWVARATLGYGLVSETPTSVVLLDNPLDLSNERPLVHTFSGSVEVEKTQGQVLGRVRGSIEHEAHGDLTLANGRSVAQDRRDNSVYLAALRLGYGGSPILQPFLEGELGTRRFTDTASGAGESSLISGLKAGLEFNRSEKLSGEISVGYGAEAFDDGTVDGLTAEANLTWSPVRGTTIALDLATSIDAASTDIADASRLYEGSLTATRNFTSRWSGTLGAAASHQAFKSGREDSSLSLSLEGAYALNRNLALLARLEHALFDSTDRLAVYEDTTALIGLRLQK